MSGAPDLLRQAREAADRRDRQNTRVLRSLALDGGGPDDPGMAARIDRLEADMRDVKTVLGRLEPAIAGISSQLPHLATQASLERVRGEIMTALESKPSRSSMWTMGIALFALVVAAMSAGAAYLPLVAHSLHGSP
jgi:hypothetical protein